MQQEPAVAEADNLVLVGRRPASCRRARLPAGRRRADELPQRPGFAVVVAVGGRRQNLPLHQDHVLLDESPGERSGMDLDALPRRREDSGNSEVAAGCELELGREPPVPPGQPVVVGVADVAVLDVVVVPRTFGGFEETGAGACRVEHKDPARPGVHQQAWIPVPLKPNAGAHHLLSLPGAPAVTTAP
ncbi:hypothetical protein D9M72_278500 [compost metagenome]